MPEPSASASSAAAATPSFHERLLPGIGAWIVIAVLGATFGVVLVPLSYTLAAVVGVIGVAVLCALAYLTSPVLAVREGQFTMGRARIPVRLLGEPVELRGEQWALTMGQDFEPMAHHCTRGWIHAGVRAEVLDDEDPTTAWVASSRRPEDLALALRAAQRNRVPAGQEYGAAPRP